jgi:precorrin-6B methylase 2
MNTSQPFRACLLTLCCLLPGVSVVAQTTPPAGARTQPPPSPEQTQSPPAPAPTPATPDPYEPVVGQDGKNVIWVPTPQSVVEKMLDIANVTASDYVIDLGSGDGRTVIAAARRGARALGVEYNPDLVALSQRNAARANVGDRAEFIKADLFETDLSDATVITMFLLNSINIELRPQLLQLRPGTRIVSNTFGMEEWTADDQTRVTENCQNYCTVLFWIVPADVQGSWQLGPDARLVLVQQFQGVSGVAEAAGSRTEITNARLRGEEIAFRVGEAQYTGRVTGNMMTGTMVSGGTTTTWSAARASR